jgi:hypothetical protein
MVGAKGDVRIRGKQPILLEAKATTNATMSVEHAWLVKIAHEAQASGSIPALSISFVTPEGKQKISGDWVAVPLHIFRELTEE